MRLKLTVLTILVGFLSVLSFYSVFSRQSRDGFGHDYQAVLSAQAQLGAIQSSPRAADSQTGYILPVFEPDYWPIRKNGFPEPVLGARSFLLYDMVNGKILLEKDSRRTLPIASLTKILSALVMLDNLPEEEVITIDAASRNVDGEGADFYLGEKFYVRDLLAAMLIKSSNDAATALARAVEKKTGQGFADLMNNKARAIGLESSLFLDPAGLNDNGYSTVQDLLALVLYAKQYSEMWELLRSPAWEMAAIGGKISHSFTSTNKLFGVWPKIVGGKTGYTDGALGCMILEVKGPDEKSPLLAIILGSANRFEETKKLLDWAGTAFRWK